MLWLGSYQGRSSYYEGLLGSFEEKSEYLKTIVNARIGEAVAKAEPVSLYAPIRYLLEGGGKRIRPILLLMSAEAVGGAAEQALDAAVGVELLHNFTLVHDDIMDDDQTRRGRATVHHKWDEGTAILAGDSLVALAYRMLLRTDVPKVNSLARIFTDAIIEVCEGQALDKEFESREDVSVDEYMEMIGKKTARLFAVACELGGLVGGGNEERVDALRGFGKHLGLAFQIQDDLLDILSPEEVTGKTFGSDITQGKKTYLVVSALGRFNSSQRQRLRAVLGKRGASRSELVEVRDLFENTGVMLDAREIVNDHLARSRSCLQDLTATAARDHLEEIVHRLAAREA